MVAPEIVELIIDRAWGCLSTSSHQHGLSMTRWMLVSHDWLKIVVAVVFRDLWITSDVHLSHILRICRTNTSFVCELAGITEIHQHLTRTCRCLTISVYHKFQQEYADQCTQLVEYATADSHCDYLFSDRFTSYMHHRFAIQSRAIATFISNFIPAITSLHFVLVDCTATYRAWDTARPPLEPLATSEYPNSLIELHVTFAYTAPPPALLMDAPRGTFFPPPAKSDLPRWCRFDGIQRLVVREANSDFVAFLITACPRLKTIESTAEFSREDVPPKVPAYIRDHLAFMRLPRTVNWGLIGSTDALPHKHHSPQDWVSSRAPARHASAPQLEAPVQKKRNPLWRWRILERVKRVLRERK
ncbi:hypothetical protein C8R45DRAFT_1158909 [Mycena sanguinolenta]|nr:hypothetical protein C8R45DRAFT_1158909 [Mycena sanguinolenta]